MPSGSIPLDGHVYFELAQGGPKSLRSNSKLLAQPLVGLWLSLAAQHLDHLAFEFDEVIVPGRRADDFEVRRGGAISTQRKLDRLWGRRVSLLDGELKRTATAPEVEITLTPSMKIARATQTQPGLLPRSAGLAGVMDDEDRHMVLSL